MHEHFNQLQWILFARGGEEAEGMRSHLERGCPVCVRDHEFLSLLEATLHADRVPVPAAQHANALAAPAYRPRLAPTSGLRLAFDNFTAPMPAHLRSGNANRRHCVYDIGRQGSLEVMVERLHHRSGWSVLGQLLTPAGAARPGCRVSLKGSADGADTLTNPLGEFSFQRSDDGPWQLEVEIQKRNWKIAPLLMPQ